MAVNHCKNRIKYLARRHDRDRDELDESTQGSSTGNGAIGSAPPRSPDAALAGVQMEEVLREAINSLDAEQKMVVILRDIEDLSIEEICAITDMPDGTVKSRLHRARLALRKKLQRAGIGQEAGDE